DAAGQAADHVRVADLCADPLDRLLDERAGRPRRLAAADAECEVREDLVAARRVRDLGVELHAEDRRVLGAERGDRQVRRRGECAVAGGRAVDVVAVARPDRDRLALLEAIEQLVGFLDHELRPAILALPRRDRGPARLRDELHAVADPENGYTELEQLLVQRRHVLVVHGRRAARKDDPLRQPLADEVGGYGRRVDLAVDALLADAPGNELRELRAVVEYEDAILR